MVVEEPHVAVVVVKKEFDWLNEGLEGADFDDDVFGVVSPPQNVPPEPKLFPLSLTMINLNQPLIHLSQTLIHLL